MKDKINKTLRILGRALGRNLGWKIVSLIVAMTLWGYIVSTDPTITQEKTLTGVNVATSGLTVLESRKLALLTDPASEFTDVRVKVRVPQASYSRVTNESVRVELDLSQVRQIGKQEVELVGVTNYGEVVQVTPAKLEVVVESLDERTVPINVDLIGTEKNSRYWYNVSRTNPAHITVSGPTTVVQQVTSANARIDVTGRNTIYNSSAQLVLMDSMGKPIPQQLRKSSSSATVSVEIYPTKQLKVNSSIETATVGTLPEGYQVTGVEVQPETVTVAGSESLLSELESLSITPINVGGRKQSFSLTTPINLLRNLQYISSDQATVTVFIEEQITSEIFKSVPLLVVGKKEGQMVRLSQNSIPVKVIGLYSRVSELVRGDIVAIVDVSKLDEGTHDVRISISVNNGEDLTYELDVGTVSVTITQ